MSVTYRLLARRPMTWRTLDGRFNIFLSCADYKPNRESVRLESPGEGGGCEDERGWFGSVPILDL